MHAHIGLITSRISINKITYFSDMSLSQNIFMVILRNKMSSHSSYFTMH